jgi:hypothetical protein
MIHEQAALAYLDDGAKRVVEMARQRADVLNSHVIRIAMMSPANS